MCVSVCLYVVHWSQCSLSVCERVCVCMSVCVCERTESSALSDRVRSL